MGWVGLGWVGFTVHFLLANYQVYYFPVEIVPHPRLQNRLQNLSDKFNKTKTPTVCETVGVFSIQQEKFYLVGAARNLLARKIITTSASAAKNILGMPTSSAKPVLGKAVDVGITVWVVLAICVNAAPSVTVAGTFGVTEGPLVAGVKSLLGYGEQVAESVV